MAHAAVQFHDRDLLNGGICFVGGSSVAHHAVQTPFGMWDLSDLLAIRVGDNTLTICKGGCVAELIKMAY